MSISMKNRRLAWIYGLAASGVLVAGLSPWWLSPLIGDTPPMRLMLILVVTAVAWMGGPVVGLFAIAMGAAAIVLANDQPDQPSVLAVRLVRFISLTLLIDLLFAQVHAHRRRAERRERALALSESRHRRLVEAAAEGIWAIGPDGRTTYASAQSRRDPRPRARRDRRPAAGRFRGGFRRSPRDPDRDLRAGARLVRAPAPPRGRGDPRRHRDDAPDRPGRGFGIQPPRRMARVAPAAAGC